MSHTLTESPRPKAAEKTFPALVWEWLACFRSVHLAIVLISLLAIGTLIGVYMPQEGLVDPLQIKKTFGPNYRLLKAMGLFNVYSSYWFITLEVLFFFNLLLGSFQWLRPAYNAAVQKNFCGPETIQASPNHLEMATALSPSDSLETVKAALRKARYRVFQSPTDANRLYASKASWSRLGPAVAHFGILILLLSSLYGAFTGFKAQKIAVPGETFTIPQSNVFVPNVNLAFWQGSIPDWQVRVNDFRIEFYKEQPDTVKQYYCDLDILKPDGTVVKSQTISVNHPVDIGDVTIYQASFSPTGKLFFNIDGKPRVAEVNSQFQNRNISVIPLDKKYSLAIFPFIRQQDPGVTENHARVFLREGDRFVGAAPGKMPKNLKLVEGGTGTLGGHKIQFIKPEIATGLQIKKAPEVPWMYLSYLIISIGTAMCFFSQRQLWVAFQPAKPGKDGEDAQPPQVVAMYRTNKARLSFMKELTELKSRLETRLISGDSNQPNEVALR